MDVQCLSLPESVNCICLQNKINLKYENMGMVLRYVLWYGYLPECAGIFFKKDRVIVDRTKPSRDHLRQSLTKLDKKVLSRLETLGQKMFSCKDRYVVPDLQTYFFILLLVLIFALFFPVGQVYLK